MANSDIRSFFVRNSVAPTVVSIERGPGSNTPECSKFTPDEAAEMRERIAKMTPHFLNRVKFYVEDSPSISEISKPDGMPIAYADASSVETLRQVGRGLVQAKRLGLFTDWSPDEQHPLFNKGAIIMRNGSTRFGVAVYPELAWDAQGTSQRVVWRTMNVKIRELGQVVGGQRFIVDGVEPSLLDITAPSGGRAQRWQWLVAKGYLKSGKFSRKPSLAYSIALTAANKYVVASALMQGGEVHVRVRNAAQAQWAQDIIVQFARTEAANMMGVREVQAKRTQKAAENKPATVPEVDYWASETVGQYRITLACVDHLDDEGTEHYELSIFSNGKPTKLMNEPVGDLDNAVKVYEDAVARAKAHIQKEQPVTAYQYTDDDVPPEEEDWQPEYDAATTEEA